MMCKRRYCNETVLPWLDPDYCGTSCRAAAINAREQPKQAKDNAAVVPPNP